ncbi:alpha/beta superfamily hydrolase [Comamonas sp. BIGb0152]|uniref:alpha/beta hydrolase n=1 Tax=Comamonas sp. BIGb0152 TaxID=2940601 RepID=UPI0021681B46|nr:alpha/beta fold hydrolase [Comamonas sp. BIGb0152]MCS4294376.1 alpha/beta superfamily hydrolase [Comamonas sp. BIGb0152]
MNAQTERFTINGPAGILEVARDLAASPDGLLRGTAIIAHPHPLFAGTMDNKVVQTLARAFVSSGWTALRFNFRGVGQSAGSYDEGRGEREDFLAVVAQLAPQGNLALAGFSFGSFVMSHALVELWPQRQIDKAVFVGTAASRFAVATLPPEAHERTLVVHGEADDTVPLSAVMDWARPQILPVTVVPGGGHFFHGQLPLLKGLVARHLLSPTV